MVDVDMRVDEVADGAGADAPDRGDNLGGDLRILGIDHQDAVRTRQYPDPASGGVVMGRVETGRAGQHVKVRCDLFADDLDLGEIHLLLGNGSACKHRNGGDHGQPECQDHCSPPMRFRVSGRDG